MSNVPTGGESSKILNGINEEQTLVRYKEKVKLDGEQLLKNDFPTTILRLNALLQTPQFTRRSFRDIRSGGDAGVTTVKAHAKRSRAETRPSCELIRSNGHLIELVNTVKPFMIKLVEDAKLMKMWVAFMIPQIHCGNNFGVEIQEEVLVLVQAVESAAAIFYEKITGYFVGRAKMVRKVLKYPQVEDFKRSVWELDEREYIGFCMVMKEIRNQYCALHDIFTKNLDKIMRPRSDVSSALLY